MPSPRPEPTGRKDAILRAVAYVGERLLAGDGWQERIEDVLAELGHATAVDRVYVFEVQHAADELLTYQRYEWVADGVVPQIDNPELQGLPFEAAGFGRWAKVLSEGGSIHGAVDSFPESERDLLRQQDIVSLVVVPVTVERRWWGFIGFDATSEVHDWSDAEVDALRVAAGALGAAIGKEQLVEELRSSRARYVEAFRREREVASQLRELDAMKSAFLDAVSHELRTPLHTIIGAGLTLQAHDEVLDPDLRRTVVDRLVANGERLASILGDLLDLKRLQSREVELRTERLELGPFVRSLVAACAPLSGRRVEIEVAPGEVDIDPTVVARVLGNLLENAAVHTPASSSVWVRARPHAGGARITVEDDGPGVPARLREIIFEPFAHGETSRRHSPGTGIGLDLVGRFAGLHGGRAWCEEREGGGAVFHAELPAPASGGVTGAGDVHPVEDRTEAVRSR